MAQCSRCIHGDVCRYSDKIAELKSENPFIKDITCNYQVYGENPKPVQKKSARPAEQPQADVNENTPQDNDPKAELKALPIASLKMGAEITNELQAIGIKAIGDVYTYEQANGWSGCGLDRGALAALSGKLEAFNLPALKI